MPISAMSTIASIVDLGTASPSAVPWISTIPADAVATTFRSTRAAESSRYIRSSASSSPGDDPDARRGDRLAQHALLQVAARRQLGERQREGDEPPRDRRRARPAVGLEHVAVDRDRALADAFELHRGAERAPDEPLDLLRASARRPCRARRAASRRGGFARGCIWYSAVSHPLPLPFEKRRDLRLDRRGAEDHRPAGAVEDRALRGAVEAGDHLDGAERVELATIGTGHGRTL